ncbi:unnamed protein product [Cylicocyclus nassatus]|uniref:Uncharacterized protein n=1 Tax=Cylicocyclus nassatus TaxID=53992 RepID=A0AA36H743_CYLNA|nr:unnamed protein product [Cylicocyclus nassatus]
MVRQRRNTSEDENNMPQWAIRLIERFDRGHELRLTVGKVRTQQFHDSFLVRIIRTWNALPENAVKTTSVFVFNREDIDYTLFDEFNQYYNRMTMCCCKKNFASIFIFIFLLFKCSQNHAYD